MGLSLWRSAEGEIYAAFLSRTFSAGSERRFFDYLRAVDGTAEATKTVKAWILDEYRVALAERPELRTPLAAARVISEYIGESDR